MKQQDERKWEDLELMVTVKPIDINLIIMLSKRQTGKFSDIEIMCLNNFIKLEKVLLNEELSVMLGFMSVFYSLENFMSKFFSTQAYINFIEKDDDFEDRVYFEFDILNHSQISEQNPDYILGMDYGISFATTVISEIYVNVLIKWLYIFNRKLAQMIVLKL